MFGYRISKVWGDASWAWSSYWYGSDWFNILSTNGCNYSCRKYEKNKCVTLENLH